MVNTFYIMYVSLIFSLGFNLCVVAAFFAFKDLKRILKNWFLLKFKISRKDLIHVTFFHENKRIEQRYLRIKDGTIKPPDEGHTYNADSSKIVHDDNGIPNLHYIWGNSIPLDIYDVGEGDFTSAQLQDSAIKLAMVAAEAGPLFEFISFVKKWLPYLVIAIVIIAAVLGILVFVVFEMAGNVSSLVPGTEISI